LRRDGVFFVAPLRTEIFDKSSGDTIVPTPHKRRKQVGPHEIAGSEHFFMRVRHCDRSDMGQAADARSCGKTDAGGGEGVEIFHACWRLGQWDKWDKKKVTNDKTGVICPSFLSQNFGLGQIAIFGKREMSYKICANRGTRASCTSELDGQ